MKQDVEIVGNEKVCSEMESSLAVAGDAAALGVTQFANEACEEVTALTPYVSSPYVRVSNDLQDLKSYFERPRLFATGTFTTGGTSNLQNIDIDQTFLTATFPQWSGRLSGVYGLRFTTCFRLQIAATAFHQGVLVASFQYGNTVGSTASKFDRGLNPAACTNLPHVRLDVSELTMVELKVPFLYPVEFRPVTGTDINAGVLGHFSLNSILPNIAVAGVAPMTYKLYAWLEDIEFFGADNNASSTIVLQAGPISTSGGLVAKELRSSKIVSRGLTAAADTASFISRHVPMLSSIAGPTAWALDIAAGVAKYFGFSKPLVQEPPVRMVPYQSAGESNVDLPFAGYAVGPMQSNTLTFDGVVGATEVDEMSLAFVTKQFSQICRGAIATSNVHGTQVYATPVTPSAAWFRAPILAPYCNIPYPRNSASLISNSGNSFLPSSLFNISSYFRLWRGNIIYRFTFAKTKFHGGRYLVSFNPRTQFYNTPIGPATVDGPEVVGGLVQPFGYSMMIDMRDSNVFEFEVPYFSEMPYVNFASNIGSLSVVCIDPLQANANVPTAVPFLVEVAGGANFELADYAGVFFPPYPNGVIYQQAGEITASGLKAAQFASTFSPSQHTIGEKITSIKQLIQIPSFTRNFIGGTLVSTIGIPPWFFYAGPSSLDAVGGTPIGAATVYTGCSYSPGALAGMYVFARGSADAHVYNDGSTTTVSVLHAEQNPLECGTGIVTYTDYQGRTNSSSLPKVVSTNGALHVRFPAFQAIIRQLVSYGRANAFFRSAGSVTPSNANFSVGHYGRIIFQSYAAANDLVMVGCNAGDDATLSTYIGPEPVVIPNVASTNVVAPDWYPGIN